MQINHIKILQILEFQVQLWNVEISKYTTVFICDEKYKKLTVKNHKMKKKQKI